MQSLKTLGGVLLNLDKALVATGKQLNAKTVALVKNVTITGPKIDVEVMIANTAAKPIPNAPPETKTSDTQKGE